MSLSMRFNMSLSLRIFINTAPDNHAIDIIIFVLQTDMEIYGHLM